MKKVLIIDDDTELLSTIGDCLKHRGFAVLLASTGKTGLELAQTEVPDLILSDIMIGDLLGYDVLEHLRGQPLTANTPVILMTGMADLHGLRRGMKLGADDYLPKPFSLVELAQAVESRLAKQDRIKAESDRQLQELRSNLTSMLPHELLTPLNGILGAAEILATDSAAISAEEVRELAMMIGDSGNRLHRLIHRFLLYAQVELAIAREEASIQREETELHHVVSKAAFAAAERCGRRADLAMALESMQVATCVSYLDQIVQELVDNAAKFSPPGQLIRVSLKKVSDRIELRITDQGVGMKLDEIRRAGAFVQFDRKLREQQGTGLGIILIHRLSRLLGGAIDIESVPSKGTTVTVLLPLSDGTEHTSYVV